jgi:hypothetical protein
MSKLIRIADSVYQNLLNAEGNTMSQKIEKLLALPTFEKIIKESAKIDYDYLAGLIAEKVSIKLR